LSLLRSCQPVCGLWDLAVFQNEWNKYVPNQAQDGANILILWVTRLNFIYHAHCYSWIVRL
jgi:hypothetical protein